MVNYEAVEGLFHGERCIWLRWGIYEAALLPDAGGNLIAFRDTEKGYRFLHEPAENEMENFRNQPFIYGMPVLFPPNRYEDGHFKWQSHTYQFPVNEEKHNNHLHGFAYHEPWHVEDYGATSQDSYVAAVFKVDQNHRAYAHFPHEFTLRLRYGLSANGLSQHVQLVNDGQQALPCALGFHTALNAPFAVGSNGRDCKLKMSIGERWELNDRMLPTGNTLPATEVEKQLQNEGVYPFGEEMDNHYRATPQNGRNFAVVEDKRAGVSLVYDVGTAYRHWMVWNNFSQEGFVCPEPQVNMVNAPNVSLPKEIKGLFSINQGEIWESCSRMYVIEQN